MQNFFIRITKRDGDDEHSVESDLSKLTPAPVIHNIVAGEAPPASASRFVKRFDHAGKHVATLDTRSGIEYADGGSNNGMTTDEALASARNLTILGGDWQPASIAEAIAIVDYNRSKPAVDPEFFPWIKSARYWMRDNDGRTAWSSASAWGVYFYYGLVYVSPRYDDGFALAVRRAGQ